VSEGAFLNIAIALMGVGATVMGIGFSSWSNRVNELISVARSLEAKVVALTKEVHIHQAVDHREIEHRLSRVEAKTNGKA
jgi:hypothetical protein